MKEIKISKFYVKEDGTKIPFEDISKEERERIADQRLANDLNVVRSLTKFLINLKSNNFDDAS